MSLWASVLLSAVSLVWSASVLSMVHKLNIVAFVLLVGVWATLQFRSIYREDPDVARLLERCGFWWWLSVVRGRRARNRSIPLTCHNRMKGSSPAVLLDEGHGSVGPPACTCPRQHDTRSTDTNLQVSHRCHLDSAMGCIPSSCAPRSTPRALLEATPVPPPVLRIVFLFSPCHDIARQVAVRLLPAAGGRDSNLGSCSPGRSGGTGGPVPRAGPVCRRRPLRGAAALWAWGGRGRRGEKEQHVE